MNESWYLKNGRIVDGTGGPARPGGVLIKDGKIEAITAADSPSTIPDAREIDCGGNIIAPGFIDAHSHMDYFAIADRPEHFEPFAAQGITSMVVGNCGFSPFGFHSDTPHRHLIESSLFKEGHESQGAIDWNDFSGYRNQVRSHGVRHNLLSLVGHGVCRTSFHGFSPQDLNAAESAEMLALLEEALDQGAAGVSLGLQYKPGVFANREELKSVARLVQRKNKILTVHAKAYSIFSGTYPMNPFGKAHNLRAIDEMLDLARETGVKLQFSHLIFVGRRTWPTMRAALEKFDSAIADGVDVKFDMFPNCYGVSFLNSILPEWVMAGMPDVLERFAPMLRLRFEAWLGFKLVGITYDDIQILDAVCAKYESFNGQRLGQIAKACGQSTFRTLVDILSESRAEARMMMHTYYADELVQELMRHPAALFMTDAWPEPEQAQQNASVYGAFPKFLSLARDSGCLTLEAVVAKMTGQAAERFQIQDRGLLKPGLAADVVVFDWERIADNTDLEHATASPTGIAHVFINGRPVVSGGRTTGAAPSGEFLAARS